MLKDREAFHLEHQEGTNQRVLCFGKAFVAVVAEAAEFVTFAEEFVGSVDFASCAFARTIVSGGPRFAVVKQFQLHLSDLQAVHHQLLITVVSYVE